MSSPTQTYMDSITFGQQVVDVSYARKPNGSLTWEFTQPPTPGISNDSTILLPASPPMFAQESGLYPSSIFLTLSHTEQNAKIYYTLDGSIPTSSSTKYVSPILIDSSKVVRAFAKVSGRPNSSVVSKSYIIGATGNLPVMSLITDPKNLYSPDSGIFVYYDSIGSEWERPITAHYFNRENNTKFEIDAGVRVHGGASRSKSEKSMRLYFKSKYGEPKLEYKIFKNSEVNKFDELVLRSGSNDMIQMSSRWVLFRDQLVTDLYSNTNGYYTHGNFTQVYLNGKPWGIYNIREHISESFLKNNMGILDGDLRENFDLELGDNIEWDILWNYLNANPILDDEKFKFVEQRIDIDNLIDYQIYEIYAGNEDWPHYNLYWVRDRRGGKWNNILWDVDRAFRTYAHSIWNSLAWALRDTVRTDLYYSDAPYKIKGTLVLRRLMTNENFKNKFIARFTDLLNSEFLPSNVIRKIDSLRQHLQSDINFEFQTWGGSSNSWLKNIDSVRYYAQIRTDSLRKYIREQFGFSSNKIIAVNNLNPSIGKIWLNNLLINENNWSGSYFKGMKVTISAAPAVGYKFIAWKDTTLPKTATFTQTISKDIIIEPIFAIDSAPIAIQPNDVIINEYWRKDNGTRYSSIGNKPIEGTWIELLVTKSSGVDLRGWRLTSNENKTTSNPFMFNEGSIIFGQIPQLANVPAGTYILIIAEINPSNNYYFTEDDLDYSDSTMILYLRNKNLYPYSDPNFKLIGTNHNLALLHPGKSDSFIDDIGIDFIAEGNLVTPSTFGISNDGVNFVNPFVGIGDDDGAIFANSALGIYNNDDGIDPNPHDIYPGRGGWIVDPSKEFSGDDPSNPSAINILTPGKKNYGLTTDVAERIIPKDYVLYQNYPNPFNPTTRIRYSIPNSEKVELKIYDILGREVAVLMNDFQSSGVYELVFDSEKYRLASGVYIINISASKFKQSRKMILLK